MDGIALLRLTSPRISTFFLEVADNYRRKFNVHMHEAMPKRYHYSHTPRIASIYTVPKYGYALTTSVRGESNMTKG